jgi:hypothetical protein
MAEFVGYPGAARYPGKATGERVDAAGNAVAIRYIVIHGTGWPQTFDRYLVDSQLQCAVTYMVAKDGRIGQFESDLANHWGNGVVTAGAPAWWQSGTPNQQSISIEHEKWSKTNTDEITPAQALASFALMAWLCRMYSIPTRAADALGGIAPHSQVNPVYRSFCPGPYPWADLYAAIRAPHVYIPSGWTDKES